MSRDDEIAVIKRADGKWWIGHVQGENYDYYSHEAGQYHCLEDALIAAHKLDQEHRCTEYGVRIHGEIRWQR